MKKMENMTLDQIKELAREYGYDGVEIRKICVEYDWETEEETGWEYEVSFGHDCTEVWSWTFEDLDGVSYDFEHVTWED